MKVKELIQILKGFDQDVHVYLTTEGSTMPLMDDQINKEDKYIEINGE